MTPLANLTRALTLVLDMAINAAFILLVVRVVLSWLRPNLAHPLSHALHQLLYALTEPWLLPLRRLINRYTGPTMIDLSPLVALLGLVFLQAFLVRTLYQLAQTLTF